MCQYGLQARICSTGGFGSAFQSVPVPLSIALSRTADAGPDDGEHADSDARLLHGSPRISTGTDCAFQFMCRISRARSSFSVRESPVVRLLLRGVYSRICFDPVPQGGGWLRLDKSGQQTSPPSRTSRVALGWEKKDGYLPAPHARSQVLPRSLVVVPLPRRGRLACPKLPLKRMTSQQRNGKRKQKKKQVRIWPHSQGFGVFLSLHSASRSLGE